MRYFIICMTIMKTRFRFRTKKLIAKETISHASPSKAPTWGSRRCSLLILSAGGVVSLLTRIDSMTMSCCPLMDHTLAVGTATTKRQIIAWYPRSLIIYRTWACSFYSSLEVCRLWYSVRSLAYTWSILCALEPESKYLSSCVVVAWEANHIWIQNWQRLLQIYGKKHVLDNPLQHYRHHDVGITSVI